MFTVSYKMPEGDVPETYGHWRIVGARKALWEHKDLCAEDFQPDGRAVWDTDYQGVVEHQHKMYPPEEIFSIFNERAKVLNRYIALPYVNGLKITVTVDGIEKTFELQLGTTSQRESTDMTFHCSDIHGTLIEILLTTDSVAKSDVYWARIENNWEATVQPRGWYKVFPVENLDRYHSTPAIVWDAEEGETLVGLRVKELKAARGTELMSYKINDPVPNLWWPYVGETGGTMELYLSFDGVESTLGISTNHNGKSVGIHRLNEATSLASAFTGVLQAVSAGNGSQYSAKECTEDALITWRLAEELGYQPRYTLNSNGIVELLDWGKPGTVVNRQAFAPLLWDDEFRVVQNELGLEIDIDRAYKGRGEDIYEYRREVCLKYLNGLKEKM